MSQTFDSLEYFTEKGYEPEDECDRCGSKTCYGYRECGMADDVYIGE